MSPRSEGLPARTDLRAAMVGLVLQYGRFAVVGLGATAVHVAVYAGTIELLGLAPLVANALGFAAGVNISFIGHRRWTFAGGDPADARRSRRGSGSWRCSASRSTRGSSSS